MHPCRGIHRVLPVHHALSGRHIGLNHTQAIRKTAKQIIRHYQGTYTSAIESPLRLSPAQPIPTSYAPWRVFFLLRRMFQMQLKYCLAVLTVIFKKHAGNEKKCYIARHVHVQAIIPGMFRKLDLLKVNLQSMSLSEYQRKLYTVLMKYCTRRATHAGKRDALEEIKMEEKAKEGTRSKNEK